MAEKHKDVSTEVPSYFISGLLSGIGNLVSSGVGAVGNLASSAASGLGNLASSAASGLGNLATNGLSGLYTGADKLLGGILPGGQAFGQGYLGQLYTGADKMLGGYLPNIGGGAASGGAGYTPQYMAAQKAFNALPGTSVGPGQVGTSFMGGPMSVSSVNTPLAAGGMSGFDKAMMGLQGVGLLGSIFSGNKGTAQAAAMYPQQMMPGAGRTSPLQQQVAQDPAMQSSPTGVGTSKGQGANKTPGLNQVTAGSTDEMVGEIRSTIKDLEEAIKEVSKFSTEGDDRSPLEAARDSSGLNMDTGAYSDSNLGTNYGLLR